MHQRRGDVKYSFCSQKLTPGEAGSSWSRGSGTEGPRFEGCGDGTEGSRVGVFGDSAEGSGVRVFRDGTEGSVAVAKSVGDARPPGSADPLVRAVERLLDVGHEPGRRSCQLSKALWPQSEGCFS